MDGKIAYTSDVYSENGTKATQSDGIIKIEISHECVHTDCDIIFIVCFEW